MEAMFLLIAISLVFVVAIGVAFWWAIFAGQFDDSDSAARSILTDDDPSGGIVEPCGGAGPQAGQGAEGCSPSGSEGHGKGADGNAGGKKQ